MTLDLEQDLMPIEHGLASEIYLHAYERPKSGYEISFEIYEKYHYSINIIIKKLNPEGYFLPVPIKGKTHPKWISSVHPILQMIEFIKTKDEILFTDFEKHVLMKILESEFFRKYTSNQKILQQQRGDLNAIDFILLHLDCVAVEYLNSKTLCNIGQLLENQITSKEQYDTLIENSLRSSSKETFKEVVDQVIEFRSTVEKKSIPEWMVDDKMQDDVFSFIKTLAPFVYAPLSLMKKIKGISVLGQLEDTFKGVIEESHEMDRFAEFLIKKDNS